MTEGAKFEPYCPGGCHSGDFPDFDHYCDAAQIQPGEEGAAFGAWLNAISGWDGLSGPLDNLITEPEAPVTKTPLHTRALRALDQTVGTDWIPQTDEEARALGERIGVQIGRLGVRLPFLIGLYRAAREDRPAKAVACSTALILFRMDRTERKGAAERAGVARTFINQTIGETPR